MPDVFLSYSREDQVVARRFAEALESEGFGVWWDQALSAGQAFDRVTEKALEEARSVVVLWSKHSVDSNWVRAEATQAHATQRLVPVTIELCKRPIMFELTHTADLVDWAGDRGDPRWRALVRGLRGSAGDGRDANQPSPVAALASGPKPALRSRWVWMAAAAAGLMAVAGLVWVLKGRVTPGEPVQAARVQPSVAVLPFDDMSPGKDQGYLADGIAEEILNSLARIPGLTVIARNSSFAYRDRKEGLKEFGHTLGATHLLEGSVRKSGDQLRITTQMIDARTDAHLWSRTYDRPLQDVFKIQDEVAAAVAETLQVSLGVGEGSRVPGSTRNVEAWDAMMAALKDIQTSTPDSLQRGLDGMVKAVALDPSWAEGWMRLSDTYLAMASFLPNPPDGTWQEKSDRAFDEARRLAPDAFYVQLGYASRAMQKGDWKEAGRRFDDMKARAAAQGIQSGFDFDRAGFLMLVGRLDEARILMEREKSRNPLDGSIAWNLAELYADLGMTDAAMAEFDRGVALGGPYPLRDRGSALLTALAGGDRAQIQQKLQALISATSDTAPVPGIDINKSMMGLLGDRERSLAELRRLQPKLSNLQQAATVGAWAAYYGDPEYALSIFGPQSTLRTGVPIMRLWRPVLHEMRKLPELKQLVINLGLVDYWRANGWGQPCQPIPGGDDFECH